MATKTNRPSISGEVSRRGEYLNPGGGEEEEEEEEDPRLVGTRGGDFRWVKEARDGNGVEVRVWGRKRRREGDTDGVLANGRYAQ